ncbi:MAG TPA: DUF2505 family protein [bacterium]|nr:DUF2505 family protein [bacterium]
MKVNLKQPFDFPLDVVLRAREERFINSDKIEGMRKPKFIERTEDEKRIETKREFNIALDRTPASIKKMLAPDMFRFIESAVWDKNSNVLKWEMVPGAQKDRLVWKGITKYYQTGDKSERSIECDIRVRVPIIGDAIERMIAEGFKKSQQKDFLSIAAMARLITEENL